jgi:methionyl-tRNA synthetase
MKDKFYITTPIYYVNWLPHIGHFYSSLIVDVIARYNKISWKEVRFTTWVDENSQKTVISAEQAWLPVMDYLDQISGKHIDMWDKLGIEYTDFIRTTEERHHMLVSEVLQKTFDNWDIYEGIYEWMYCVWCEAFKKDEDLVYLNKTTNATFPITKEINVTENIVKVCPDHLKEPDTIKEKNYFFRLSKYGDKLLDFYKKNPSFVQPQARFNEVIAFVERWLEDFSISRETNKFGIKLPFDEKQVTYVWFDALYNYITSCRYSRWWDKNNTDFVDESDFWPADLHVVWKDIIRFHAIYWPAMLMSVWYELPKNILTTGYFTIDGQKISKSLWNAINPVEFIENYNKELLTLYLLSAFNIGQDGVFSTKDAILMYNAKLANNMWNLVNRVVVLALKVGGVLKRDKIRRFIWISLEWDELKFDNKYFSKDSDNIFEEWDKYKLYSKEFLEWFNLKWVLDLSFSFLDKLNNFVTEKEPWQTIKDESKQEETMEVLYTVAEWLRLVWLTLYPFFPEKMSEMFVKLWLNDYKNRLENGELNVLLDEKVDFVIKEKGEALFSRVEV